MALKVASSNLATHLILFKNNNLNIIKNKKNSINNIFLKTDHKILKLPKISILKKKNLIHFETVFNIFSKTILLNSSELKRLSKKQKSSFSYVIHFNENLKFLKKKINFKNNFYIFILNLKWKKPFINVMAKRRNKIALSVGIVLRYLHIKEKKLKKKLSSLYLMLKITILLMERQILSSQKMIFEIKGLRKDLYLILKFLKARLLFKNLTIVHTPNVFGKSIKYKKIRAIKKNLKKKLIKID